jgi:hypothetical protein
MSPDIPPVINFKERGGGQDKEILDKRAQQILDRWGGPYTIPDFKARKVPGMWGARTLPLPFTDGRGFFGVVFLAQQFPSMAKVIMVEDQTGEHSVVHNFDPEIFLTSVTPLPANRINAHLGLVGDVTIQNPEGAGKVLEYMETEYPHMR